MTSTLVDEYPSLLYQILFFPVYVYVIVIKYLALIRIIVVYFFGLFDHVFPDGTPVQTRIHHHSGACYTDAPSTPLKTNVGTAS